MTHPVEYDGESDSAPWTLVANLIRAGDYGGEVYLWAVDATYLTAAPQTIVGNLNPPLWSFDGESDPCC